MNNSALVLAKINEDRNETNIKDVKLRKKLEVLINNVCVQKLEENKYTFFKYFASKKKGVLYCLLLTGDELDGIYEFKIFGHNVNFENIITKDGTILRINTTSNYDLAEFDMKDVTTKIKREDDLIFKKEINKFISKLIYFDIVTIKLKNKTIELNQNSFGEIKFKKEIKNILKNKYNEIISIEGLEKKKKLYISSIDLGQKEFKKQIIDLDLITEEEYNLYTKFNNELFKKYKDKFKLVEIII